MFKKMLRRTGVAFLLLLCLFSAAWGLSFEITPEGAELFRERGSVGHLYWGLYREC